MIKCSCLSHFIVIHLIVEFFVVPPVNCNIKQHVRRLTLRAPRMGIDLEAPAAGALSCILLYVDSITPVVIQVHVVHPPFCSTPVAMQKVGAH